MKSSTYPKWLRRLLVLAVIVLGATASAAGATGVRSTTLGTERIVDDWFRISTPIATPAADRIVDDSFRDPTLIATTAGDRLVDDSFRDSTVMATTAGDRIVDDSFRDPTVIATPAGDRLVDDSFRDASPVVASSASGSLHWKDFGIGAGAMLGLTLLLSGLGLGALVMRHRTGKVGMS